MNSKKSYLVINLFLLLTFAFFIVITFFHFSPKIAYVDNGKLMVGFVEASRVEKELKAENEKWKKQLKTLEDSLQAVIDNMSKEYDGAQAARKKELQDLLSARNQQINNFRQANMRKMDKLAQEKMAKVYEKANVYITEYGKKKGYSIILGTGNGGSILYGNENRYDITTEIVKGLNERYK